MEKSFIISTCVDKENLKKFDLFKIDCLFKVFLQNVCKKTIPFDGELQGYLVDILVFVCDSNRYKREKGWISCLPLIFKLLQVTKLHY